MTTQSRARAARVAVVVTQPWIVILGLVILGWGAARLVIEQFPAWTDATWPLHLALSAIGALIYGVFVRDPRGTAIAAVAATFLATGVIALFIIGSDSYEAVWFAWPLAIPGATGMGMTLRGFAQRDVITLKRGVQLLGTGVSLYFGLTAVVWLIQVFHVRMPDGFLAALLALVAGVIVVGIGLGLLRVSAQER
jgi:hypothetical protein